MSIEKYQTEFIEECKRKLIEMRAEALNRLKDHRLEITVQDKMSGDEIDQTVAQSFENHFAINQSRIRNHLMEIDLALARIQKGIFGVCEETNEFIEIERLQAIPYTRLSLEGAELREALQKRSAR